ncbi:hypothetical protein Q4Q34_08285 [Flavivirga abyssicola]|uniref:hypothetical protein n=1 Tax=Flavivirga abyssicola TaxID=3063533 RepID=UPI0026DFA30A|nr:hypothetical protein [Flavivirga sp. MEBiC07777]WVK15024.1 hypothetical protein Q4Q34_08285 [Flavivirga sp. MEBiC07777]
MRLTIEDLLLKKRFSDLSFQEKEFVLSLITETEYNDFRLLLINSKKSFENDFKKLNVNDTTHKILLEAFNQKFPKQKRYSIYSNISISHKQTIKPVFYIGIVSIIVAVMVIINKNLPLNSTNNVTSILNENKALLKVNKKHSSELIDSNEYLIDSIIEMNNHLRIKTEGLYIN